MKLAIGTGEGGDALVEALQAHYEATLDSAEKERTGDALAYASNATVELAYAHSGAVRCQTDLCAF